MARSSRRPNRNPVGLSLVASLLIILSACGTGQNVPAGSVPTPYYLYVTPNVAPGNANPTLTALPALGSPASSSVSNLADLQQYMLELVNQARAGNGLTPVVWDNFAAQVAQDHAEDMATYQYMSHWNRLGYGPDVRYSLAGGAEWVQENVYSASYRFDDGSPAPIEDWRVEVEKAHDAWMSSPGHRANILNPEHNHLGVGIAYNVATGDIRMAQEFINRYVELDAVPRVASPGDTLTISGELLPGATDPLVNLAYEPLPQPFTIDQLNATSAYGSPAQFASAIQPTVTPDGRFTTDIPLDQPGQPGLYHIRIWVMAGPLNPQAVDVIVWVGANPR